MPPCLLDDSRWTDLLERLESETGMDLRERGHERFREAAKSTLARHGISTSADLQRALAQPAASARLIEDLSSALTVGETFFFRNESHFKALREEVFPEIFRRNEPSRQARVWCAGCATGEEPYSIAILLDELLDARADWNIHLLATDLNPDFLVRARAATYRPWSFRGTDVHLNPRYFSGANEEFRLVSRVRDRVRFRYLNLVKDVYPSPVNGTLALDLIVFRNVAIYLKAPVVDSILRRMLQALRPGGWLVLGESELPPLPPSGFEAVRLGDATLFRKPEGGDSGADIASTDILSGALSQDIRLPAPRPLPAWLPLPESPRMSPPAETPASERLDAALRCRDFVLAEDVLSRVKETKTRAALRLPFSRALAFAGESQRARRMLDLCLEEDPLHLEAQLLKGGFLEDVGDLEGAETAYRRALYVDRGCAIAHFRLALVLQQRGDTAGSRRGFETLRAMIDGADPRAHVEHGDGLCFGRLQELVSILAGGAA